MVRRVLVAVLTAAALVPAACGDSRSNAGGASGVSSATSGASPEAAAPKAHPQVIQPSAGAHPTTVPEAVGDPGAHAPSLASVKRELKRLNLCGGATSRAEAAPVVASHGAGFVADPGTVQNVGELPVITAQLNALAKALGVTVYGISGYRSPAHSVAVGGFADDPHTRGEAEDIGVNSLLRSSAAQISEAELARFGLYRPFDPSDDPNNTEVNHVQLIPRAGPLTLAEATDTFDPDPSCE